MHLFADREARELVGTPIGQIVGEMNEVRPVREVMAGLVRGFEDTVDRLDQLTSKVGSPR